MVRTCAGLVAECLSLRREAAPNFVICVERFNACICLDFVCFVFVFVCYFVCLFVELKKGGCTELCDLCGRD